MSAAPAISTWPALIEELADLSRWLRALRLRMGDDAAAADFHAQQAACDIFAQRVLAPHQPCPNSEHDHKTCTRPGVSKATQQERLLVESLTVRLDAGAIRRDLERLHPDGDPIAQFYESFLAAYDPRRRVRRGVFYTPPPLARFVIRAVHENLQARWGLPAGLGHLIAPPSIHPARSVHILDPAAGTGVFLVEAIGLIHDALRSEWRTAGLDECDIHHRWNAYVSSRLLPRLRGHELMPAACGLANLNILHKLRETGYPCNRPPGIVRPGDSLALSATEWAENAADDGQAVPKCVVLLGNPPYGRGSGRANRGLRALLADYKQGLAETNLNALSDDCIKFVRLAHHAVVEAGTGVIGLVVNNAILDGVTHRRMRELLLRDFDDMRIVDLHGSIMRRSETPAGVVDEGVFDIQQGVALLILSRRPGRGPTGRPRVQHADLWGARARKYDRLAAGPERLPWKSVTCDGPHFLFRLAGKKSDYENWPSLADVFDVFSSGIKFRKDGLLVKNHFTRANVERMLRDMAELSEAELTARYGFRETADWRIADKRPLFESCRPEDIVEITYRPFDIRYAFYPLDRAGRLIPRGDSRIGLMRHVLSVRNLGLIFNRQVVGRGITHFLVSRRPVSHGVFYLGNRGQDYFAPLYLLDGRSVRPNLKAEFMARLGDALAASTASALRESGHPVRLSRLGNPHCSEPESVLHYLYAIFHSPTYRARYADGLRMDFPRVPLPGSADLFVALGRLGAELVTLHLLEQSVPNRSLSHSSPLTSRLPGTDAALSAPTPTTTGGGPPLVALGYPRHHDGRVFLNKECWFEGVPEAIWLFEVGGYRVCEKWLKDRRGRLLDPSEVRHYANILHVLSETRRLMTEIDQTIEAHGGWSHCSR